MKSITRVVWILSFVSLFTDVASEMLYPVIPIYLKSIGFSIIFIGVLEGVAEAIAGISKGYFGNLSDNTGKRLPFVRIGYAISSFSKPLMVLFAYPLWVLFMRSMDRLGKGIRTASRDAILSDEATPQTKGKVFGLHRAMDTTGAAIGPAVALLFLAFYPNQYKTLFWFAIIPGIIAIVLTFTIKGKKHIQPHKTKTRFLDFFKYWKHAPTNYKKLVGALVIFTMFNSSDVFLLLKIKEAGYSDFIVIGTYIFYNLIYAIFSLPLGILADKIGMKKVFIGGLFLFALVYGGMAFAKNEVLFFFLFLLYGIYSAATEGIAKAWISNLCEVNKTATAIGTFTSFQSIATLIASSLAGVIWYSLGASAAFISTAFITVGVAMYIMFIRKPVLTSDKTD